MGSITGIKQNPPLSICKDNIITDNKIMIKTLYKRYIHAYLLEYSMRAYFGTQTCNTYLLKVTFKRNASIIRRISNHSISEILCYHINISTIDRCSMQHLQ